MRSEREKKCMYARGESRKCCNRRSVFLFALRKVARARAARERERSGRNTFHAREEIFFEDMESPAGEEYTQMG